MGVDARDRIGVAFVEAVGGGAVAKNAGYLTALQNGVQRIWHDIPDGAVRGADNFTRCDDIPKRKAVGENQLCFFLNILRDRRMAKRCHKRPKAVLGMPIEKLRLSGFHRGE